MAYQFDTSGAVVYADADEPYSLTWLDLSPFVQGYIAAAWSATGWICTARLGDPAYSDLAPETLEWIIEDCEAIGHGRGKFYDDSQRQGDHFWADRQRGSFVNFPPLTVALNDAGKVVFV